MNNNPLLSNFNTSYDTAPFSKIKSSDFPEAFEKAIEETKSDIDKIVSNTEEATFENTIESLEFSGKKLDRVSSIFFNLNSAETNEEIQKIAQEVSPKLSALSNDIQLNPVLFERVKDVWEKREKLKLTGEQQMLLEKKYKGFARNGANLDSENQEQLRTLDMELSKLSLSFGEHVLADTNAFELLIENQEQLTGLPESVKQAAQSLAKSKNLKGWLFTLDYPSFVPFMTYSEDRELRKVLSLAFGSKGFQDNTNNNTQIVLDIVKKRFERARLLGYENHAAYVLEERMAENPETVKDFLNDLLSKAKPAAQLELKELEGLAKLDHIENLEKWDSSFYAERLKKKKFDFDQEALRPYFKLENVLNGAFEIAGKLFNLTFELTDDIETYHEDVQTYIVKENGEYKAVFYADFFPRKGKRGGAWMTSYKSQWQDSRPHISIVCNFTPPTSDKPSLLNFNEVTTLFHEFGHALHGILANTKYPSLSGTSVAWDFVELPSQVLENWCYEPEALALFAHHYETGELIPQELIDKIKASSNFLEGMATLRQLSFGILDMHWHGENPMGYFDVQQEELKAFQPTRLFPSPKENCMSTAFSHIFQGGYSAGYYSYKWAEVLDADAFAYFKEKGIFNKEIAQKFKDTVLSKGGTVKPMELYKSFRGQKPTNDALLERAGLKN
ncbi:MAG: M3 family metallopeptidase [Flavobacteriaceae bacterium]